MARDLSPENRARAQALVERAGTEWALDDRPDRTGRERLAAIAKELCALLDGTRELELARELVACWSNEPSKSARNAAELLKALEAGLSADAAAPRADGDSAPVRAGRDNETVELIADFLAESTEGLERVDEILIAAERDDANPEQVNALFRVFHTIKGVSAFLGADDVTRLAHVSETLLGQVRDGSRALRGRDLELVFEASSSMRRLLGVVRSAVDADLHIPVDASLPALIARIEQRTLGAVSLAPAAEPAALPQLPATPAADSSKPASKSTDA
jgi:two-component system chemotaxis sensor kinase CheA